MSEGKKRLVVLGGGPSVLTALYHLTNDVAVRSKCDITVYQMGWRLGGKAGSGRTPNGQILEHGLHILFGFYENFFAMMRRCYVELDRPEGSPMRTFDDAFSPN
ncbi:MAG: NAD(P)-binding protein, partial [Myxococcales bacterium]|nr:NAD(P)-binding protein [Myxococcales bacterium]